MVTTFDIVAIETPRILQKVKQYRNELPRTVTADSCPRSQGTPYDYYSEGDYWWPNPDNPAAPEQTSVSLTFRLQRLD